MNPGRAGRAWVGGAIGTLHVAVLLVVPTQGQVAASLATGSLVTLSALGITLALSTTRWRPFAVGLLIPELFGLVLFGALWLIGRGVGGGGGAI